MFNQRFVNGSCDELGTIQYVGYEGLSKNCYDALKRFVQFGDRIERVRLLTSDGFHAFQLSIDGIGKVFVRSGFSSGYPGEGPRTLAQALMLLEELGNDLIEEVNIPNAMLRRLNQARLTTRDLQAIEGLPAIRPIRVFDYIYPYREHSVGQNELSNFPVVMPWSIIDARLIETALAFESDPDRAIFSAFRILEDIIRTKTQLREHGTKLFSQAFDPESGVLQWTCDDAAEQRGRLQLFVGTYMAYRNPRAHRSPSTSTEDSLAEFLLINHLFRLEQSAKGRK